MAALLRRHRDPADEPGDGPRVSLADVLRQGDDPLHILPYFATLGLPVRTLEDLLAVNRHLATLRSMFNLALRWQLYEGRNPAASPGMLAEQRRGKFLTAAETQALVRALETEPCQDAASALALLILTGARKQEALRAKWELVDFGRGMLTVPLSKNGRPRHIPLSSAAVRVLQGQAARRVPGSPYVFPSRRVAGAPLEGLRGPWERAKLAAGLPGGPAHPRPAAQPGVGAGERRDAAVRDRRCAGAPPA